MFGNEGVNNDRTSAKLCVFLPSIYLNPAITQSPVEIGEQIGNVLNADADTNQITGDAGVKSFDLACVQLTNSPRLKAGDSAINNFCL